MDVFFHGNFGLDRKRMASILSLALNDSGLRIQEMAGAFSFNTPFTSPYRTWLHKTGMIESQYPIRLTQMGEIVYKHDPSLETLTTQWFLHHELTIDPERAEAWYFFIHEFLPLHKTFSQIDLLSGLTEKLHSHSEKYSGPGSTINKIISRKIIECYTSVDALGGLNLITEGNNGYSFNDNIIGPWKSSSDLDKQYRLQVEK